MLASEEEGVPGCSLLEPSLYKDLPSDRQGAGDFQWRSIFIFSPTYLFLYLFEFVR